MGKKTTYGLIFLLILWSFISLDWSNSTIHANGLDNLSTIIQGALSPDFTVLFSAISAALITIAYAATGLSIAIILGFLLSLCASGIILKGQKKIAINILVFMRAIHELMWALIFVATIGLNPISAVLAIAIPYSGMLGKVYTNLLQQTPKSAIEALKQSGANSLQVILFGYLPLFYKHFMSYTLYRFECAIRSSSILSFVGLSGLGLKITLTLGDLKYSTAFMYIYVLILLVGLVDLWSNLHRKHHDHDKYTFKLLLFFIAASWFYVGIIDRGFFVDLFSLKNTQFTIKFYKALLGFGHDHPAFLQLKEISIVLKLALETIQMSIIAITLSSIAMLTTLIASTRQYSNPIFYILTRAIYLVSRAIPELVFALIIVFIIKPGIWAGALALALHNYGILAKLCSEVVEDLPMTPLKALHSSGANRLQLLTFGVGPMAKAQIVSYVMYRWEVILRSTIVVGFIGAGGLGYYFKLKMSLFHYTHVTLAILVYFVMIRLADYLSQYVQKQMV